MKRKSFNYIQTICASVEQVFPLLCPEMETQWIPDWSYEMKYSETGFAEKNCVFQTHRDINETWIITVHNPINHHIEFHKTDNETLHTHIIIRLTEGENITHADITYCHTALNDKGLEFIENFSDDDYVTFMKEWETLMNNYLKQPAL